MKHEEFLQNYSASQFRLALSGKNESFITDEMRTKQWWLNLFNETIDQLKAGERINMKANKNEVSYWERQIELLNEFEPKGE